MATSPFAFGPGEDINEYYDEPEVLEAKVQQLVQLIKESKSIVAYSGAGISTSAQIPDYRSPTRGVWTAKEFNLPAPTGVDLTMARPTLAHVSLQKLVEVGKVKFITTTNVDGLHRRAGATSENLAELHGNCYLERCSRCKKEYLRLYNTAESTGRDHRTGAACDDPNCRGDLLDSIVHFGENLPESELSKAAAQAELSDLSLVLGTSMRVSPANKLPAVPVKKGHGNLVICNLQKTPYDHLAKIRIFGPTDTVMELVMKGLGIEIPETDAEGHPIPRPAPYSEIRPAGGVVTGNFDRNNHQSNQASSSSASTATSAPVTTSSSSSSGQPQMFAVDPNPNCPHVQAVMSRDGRLGVDVLEPCSQCGDPSENWLCLTCGQVFCSRYVQGHMAEHNAQHPDHHIAASFSDLSFWCYSCDDYIKHRLLGPVFRALHTSKFGN